MRKLLTKAKKILNNNGYMLRLAGQCSKAYILILGLYILSSYARDIILVLFPK